MYAERQAAHTSPKQYSVVVLTRDLYDYPGPNAAALVKEHKEQQARMARLSTKGRQVIVPESGHEIQLYAPDSVVVAIRGVIMTATSRKIHSAK